MITQIILFFLKEFGLRQVEQTARRQRLILYLKALQTARKSLIGLIVFTVLLQVMIFGFILSSIAAILLWPDLSEQIRAVALLVAGLVMLLVPLILMIIVFSERTWFRASGAKEMFEKEAA